MSSSSYIHGINPNEQQRLFILNEILNQRCIEKITINSGDRVLDVGSGLGLMTALFADLSGPEGYCWGLKEVQNNFRSQTHCCEKDYRFVREMPFAFHSLRMKKKALILFMQGSFSNTFRSLKRQYRR